MYSNPKICNILSFGFLKLNVVICKDSALGCKNSSGFTTPPRHRSVLAMILCCHGRCWILCNGFPIRGFLPVTYSDWLPPFQWLEDAMAICGVQNLELGYVHGSWNILYNTILEHCTRTRKQTRNEQNSPSVEYNGDISHQIALRKNNVRSSARQNVGRIEGRSNFIARACCPTKINQTKGV